MLGKTNLTALQGGAIITEVKDYRWIRQQLGINENFVRTIFKNDYLIGITANGRIAYTRNGEVWEKTIPEYANIKLNDVDWDGSRFLLVGSYTDDANKTAPLILATTDFLEYKKIEITKLLTDNSYGAAKEVLAIYPTGDKYIILFSFTSSNYTFLCSLYTDFLTALREIWTNSTTLGGSSYTYKTDTIRIAKNSSEMLVYLNAGSPIVYKFNENSAVKVETMNFSGEINPNIVYGSAFACKDELYYIFFHADATYSFKKVNSTGETSLISSGLNWMFTDGVYFNACQLFINNHNILIIKKGESIGDKTLDDLIEIAPEESMTCIEKAFGKLFIFGKQGLVLKSTNEVNNEEGIMVQYLSAKQALAQSKTYTDEQTAALAARVAVLESLHQTE